MELFEEQSRLAVHDVPQYIIYNIKQDRQDNACDGGIECRIDTGQNGLHAAQSSLHRDEADVPQAQQQTHEGTQNAEARQGAGDLGDDASPCVQCKDILVEDLIDVADDLPRLPLVLHFLAVLAKQLVQPLLLEEALDPQRRDPCRAAFGPGCLADAVLSVQQSARKRDRRQKAIDAPRQCDHTHKADDDHGKQVRRIRCEHNTAHKQHCHRQVGKQPHTSILSHH